jgi:hypothetical protein
MTPSDYPKTEKYDEAQQTISRFFRDRYGVTPSPQMLSSESYSWVNWSKQTGDPYSAFVNHYDKVYTPLASTSERNPAETGANTKKNNYAPTVNFANARAIVARFFWDRYGIVPPPSELDGEAQSWINWTNQTGDPYSAFVAFWDAGPGHDGLEPKKPEETTTPPPSPSPPPSPTPPPLPPPSPTPPNSGSGMGTSAMLGLAAAGIGLYLITKKKSLAKPGLSGAPTKPSATGKKPLNRRAKANKSKK